MGRFLFLLATALFAQEPATLSIKADVSLVNVAFIVRDQTGALAANLTKGDIEVFENGVPQQVCFSGLSTDLPLRLAIVRDVSSSQNKFNKQHIRDVQRFVSGAIESRDRVLLICFGDHIRVVSDFTNSPSHVIDVCATWPSTTVKIIRAPTTSIRHTEAKKGRLTARARYGRREMDRFAEETGGGSFDASKDDVASSLRHVAEELRSMYDIAYTSSNTSRTPGFRKVEIRIRRPGLAVRAKPGYYLR